MGRIQRARAFLFLSILTTSLSACSGFKATSLFAKSPTLISSRFMNIASIGSGACAGVLQKLNTELEASADLQACIDATPVGTVLSLPPGRLMIANTVRIDRTILVMTENRTESLPCELDDSACFQLRATANAYPTNGAGLLAITGANAAVINIIVDGNRTARVGSLAHQACVNGNNGLGFVMSAVGNGISVHGVVAKNAVCGTGFHAMGNGLRINKNLIAYNGVHDQNNLWADGMTVTETTGSQFVGNTFIDNTDVDFIFGGGKNTLITQNTVLHSDSFAGSSFAAIMLHSWPNGASSGDYTGADVSSNNVDCGARRRCGIGLYLGAESWYSSPLFGGFVHDNRINNALAGFMIERASGLIRIKDNVVANSGGLTWTTQGDRLARAYNIPDASNVQIEDTLIPRSAYFAESFSRSIPNFYNAERAWETPEALATVNTAGADYYAHAVSIAYLRVLGRYPDPVGHQYWVAQMAQGMNLSTLESLLKTSAENRQNLVTNVYRSYLGREPEAAGLQTWLNYLNQPVGAGDLISAVTAQPEYRQRLGR